MKQYRCKYVIVLLMILMCGESRGTGPAVTYRLAGGRLGDQLLNYIKARWVAWYILKKKDGAPADFFYRPFKDSDKLVMHQKEMRYESASTFGYNGLVRLKNDALKGVISKTKRVVYETNYYLKVPGWDDYTLVCIDDPLFWKTIREMVAPVNPIKNVVLPQDLVTVAVHIRRGSGSDGPLGAENEGQPAKPKQPFIDQNWPDKAPSLNFYIEQIKRLSTLVGDQKMYVYIFTDDKNPQELVTRVDAALGLANVKFDYRKEQVDALDDFFAMTQFDCLIRSNSNFSKCVEPLGNFKIVIYLKHAYWDGKEAVVDDVGVKVNYLPPVLSPGDK